MPKLEQAGALPIDAVAMQFADDARFGPVAPGLAPGVDMFRRLSFRRLDGPCVINRLGRFDRLGCLGVRLLGRGLRVIRGQRQASRARGLCGSGRQNQRDDQNELRI
jgi:hypothetical protein